MLCRSMFRSCAAAHPSVIRKERARTISPPRRCGSHYTEAMRPIRYYTDRRARADRQDKPRPPGLVLAAVVGASCAALLSTQYDTMPLTGIAWTKPDRFALVIFSGIILAVGGGLYYLKVLKFCGEYRRWSRKVLLVPGIFATFLLLWFWTPFQ